MNEKFYSLSKEKQNKIINAGYKVFSLNSYKKSPMSQIAEDANISKSLLFHYFKNKKELYLFLWNLGANITVKYMKKYKCYESEDLFEMMERGMDAKFALMGKYPHLTIFVVRAFYEKDSEVSKEIQKLYEKMLDKSAKIAILKCDPDQFIPGLDLEMMYKEMQWAAEGYLWEAVQQGDMNLEKIKKDCLSLLEFWKFVYKKREE